MSVNRLFSFVVAAAAFSLASHADIIVDPSEGTKLADGSGYVTLIRLAHQSAKANNGLLMVAFEHAGLNGIPVYESVDDGTSWKFVTYVTDQVFHDQKRCQLRWQPNLVELPRDSGNLKKGTLLLSANTTCDDEHGRLASEHLQAYASTDRGRTWVFRGTIVEGGGHPSDKDNQGVWEPNITVLNDGRMVAYYSSEKHKKDGFNQLLAHKVSTDGGASWDKEIYDLAVPGGVERPGMAAVIPLPDGRYAYTFEDIDGPDNNGQVFIKFSRDGLDWGEPSDRGWPVQTMGGAWPSACPQMAWLPIGGPQGVLIVSAERAGGNGDAGGRAFYWNKDLGRGPWWQIRAPVQKSTGNMGAGWTQAVMLKRNGQVLHLTTSSTSAAPGDATNPTKNEVLFASAPLQFNRYEAEDAARTNAAFIHDSNMSGRGRVRIPGNAQGGLEYNIYVVQAGTYPISVHYTEATLTPAKPVLNVNGSRLPDAVAQPTDGWYSMTFSANLTAGYNRITLSGAENSIDVDYIELGDPKR